TLSKWLQKTIILFGVIVPIILLSYLKLNTDPHVWIDSNTGLPTLLKINRILHSSIQEVQQYLFFLIVGLLFGIVIKVILQKKWIGIFYPFLLGASAKMIHHLLINYNFHETRSLEYFSIHNLIHLFSPYIFSFLFITELYICGFIINSIFIGDIK
ncbi:hypothetical protein V7101_20715, partial [Bacillus velezensis]|uniref:hypothetical protein n=1 Tax=Bacillus velezensis TaxID=492670 RepID=UPI002FFDF08F